MAMFEPFTLPLLGGILIGLASGGLYLLAGEIAGVTGIVRSAFNGPARGWRIAFVAGMLVAGIGAGFHGDPALTAGIDGQPLVTLIIAGLLVGIGTDIGNGCTSGHGICGLSRLSRRSLVAVLVFMASAVATVWVIRHGGLV